MLDQALQAKFPNLSKLLKIHETTPLPTLQTSMTMKTKAKRAFRGGFIFIVIGPNDSEWPDHCLVSLSIIFQELHELPQLLQIIDDETARAIEYMSGTLTVGVRSGLI